MFEIGKEVVAIKGHSQGAFKKGDVFMCEGLERCPCKCGMPYINVGITVPYHFSKVEAHCHVCHTIYPQAGIYWWFKSTSFAPLDSIDISELTEVLEKEIFT